MKEKETFSPPEDIRSDIVQKIYQYEQSLNDQVLSLRKKIKTNQQEELKPLNFAVQSLLEFKLISFLSQEQIIEQSLILFRDIFRSYLPQIEEKPQMKEKQE